MKFFKSLYIHQRFFIYIAIISTLFILSYWIEFLYQLAWVSVLFLMVFMFLDIFLLYNKKQKLEAFRNVSQKLSNSDENPITIQINNEFNIPIHVKVIDEIPFQFQKRDFDYSFQLDKYQSFSFEYKLKPTERGEYDFGNLLLYISSFLKIFSRKITFELSEKVSVYPSYIQMQKYAFLAISNGLNKLGIKKIRKIGHTMEFEKIKEYTKGDDIRTINWKATAKRAQIMVNQYQDEKSQPIYSIIDTGRAMKMPFDQLKLLDYAINSSLAFSNIAIKKGDKAGLLTFSKEIDIILSASKKVTHLNLINEALYKISTDFTESNFALLYSTIRRKITQRSLIILYTNFEHEANLKRQLPYISAIAKKHLLLVVFFKNSELNSLISEKTEDLKSIYKKSIAEKFDFEKRLIVKELEKAGVNTLLTEPSELSVNVINKYLQFKAKGMI
ncbi:DUF58 domain-containing protein [Aureivirga marina]|uniref:DUF58 domain-containing protein n=1 Tax=Aureivirga marina TaxID=1182451 RepID=UPI0018CB3FD4|nr:DUF58 domain-containing protein [Aureivirga marina]